MHISVSVQDAWHTIGRADIRFFWEQISKKTSKVLSIFFSQPNWFAELFQNNIKTLVCHKILCIEGKFLNSRTKCHSRAFFKKVLTKKLRFFFGSRSSSGWPKLDDVNKYQRVSSFFVSWSNPGVNLGFSRGGRIFKKFSKIFCTSFRSTKLIFRALPKQ